MKLCYKLRTALYPFLFVRYLRPCIHPFEGAEGEPKTPNLSPLGHSCVSASLVVFLLLSSSSLTPSSARSLLPCRPLCFSGRSHGAH